MANRLPDSCSAVNMGGPGAAYDGDDVSYLDETSDLTDGTSATFMTLNADADNESLKIGFNNGLSGIQAGDSITVYIQNIDGGWTGSLSLLPYIDGNSVATGNKVTLVPGTGPNIFALTDAIINDLGDLGGSSFAFRVVEDSTVTSNTLEIWDVDADLTPDPGNTLDGEIDLVTSSISLDPPGNVIYGGSVDLTTTSINFNGTGSISAIGAASLSSFAELSLVGSLSSPINLSGPVPQPQTSGLTFPTAINMDDDPVTIIVGIKNIGDTVTPSESWGIIVKLTANYGARTTSHIFEYTIPSNITIESGQTHVFIRKFSPKDPHLSIIENVTVNAGIPLVKGKYKVQIVANRNKKEYPYFTQYVGTYIYNYLYTDENLLEVSILGDNIFKREELRTVSKCHSQAILLPSKPVRKRFLQCAKLGLGATTKTVTKPLTTSVPTTTTSPTSTTIPPTTTETTTETTITDTTTETITTTTPTDRTFKSSQDTISDLITVPTLVTEPVDTVIIDPTEPGEPGEPGQPIVVIRDGIPIDIRTGDPIIRLDDPVIVNNPTIFGRSIQLDSGSKPDIVTLEFITPTQSDLDAKLPDSLMVEVPSDGDNVPLFEVPRGTTILPQVLPFPPQGPIVKFTDLDKGQLEGNRFTAESPIVNYWEAIDLNPPVVVDSDPGVAESIRTLNVPDKYIPLLKNKKLNISQETTQNTIRLSPLKSISPDSVVQAKSFRPFTDKYGMFYSGGYPLPVSLINKLAAYYKMVESPDRIKAIDNNVAIVYEDNNDRTRFFNTLASNGLVEPKEIPDWFISWMNINSDTSAGNFTILNPRLYQAASHIFSFNRFVSIKVSTPRNFQAELNYNRDLGVPDKIVAVIRSNSTENIRAFKTPDPFVDSTVSIYEVLTNYDELSSKFQAPSEVVYVHYNDPILRLMLHPDAKIEMIRDQFSLRSFGDNQLIYSVPHSLIFIPTDDLSKCSLRGSGSKSPEFGTRTLTLTQSTSPDEWNALTKPVMEIIGSYKDVWGLTQLHDSEGQLSTYRYPEGTFRMVFSNVRRPDSDWLNPGKVRQDSLTKTIFEKYQEKQYELTGLGSRVPSFNEVLKELDLVDQIELKNNVDPGVIRELAEGEVTGIISPIQATEFVSAKDGYFTTVDNVFEKVIQETLAGIAEAEESLNE